MPQASQRQDTANTVVSLTPMSPHLPTSITTHLLIEPLHPPLQILPLLPRQILTRVQRPVQILRQHLLVKALTRQPPRRIPPRKVLIHAAWPVEVPTGRNIVDFPLHRQVHRPVVLAIVRQQRAGRERAEDGRGRSLGELDGRGGAEAQVQDRAEEDEEGNVQRCEQSVENFLGHFLVFADVYGSDELAYAAIER
jgi:hypothetical protein